MVNRMTNDYISRQATMNAFAEYVKRPNNSDFAPTPRWNDAVEIVENLPSADVVEVVRCKDCKWWRDTDHTCKEHSLVSPMGAEEFCSRGERKDGRQNG